MASLAATSLEFGVPVSQEWLFLPVLTFFLPADVDFSWPRVRSMQLPGVPVSSLLPQPACSKVSLKLGLCSFYPQPHPSSFLLLSLATGMSDTGHH